MKNKAKPKRDKKYQPKSFAVPKGEIKPPRTLKMKILWIAFIILLTALMVLTITFKLRHYAIKHR